MSVIKEILTLYVERADWFAELLLGHIALALTAIVCLLYTSGWRSGDDAGTSGKIDQLLQFPASGDILCNPLCISGEIFL